MKAHLQITSAKQWPFHRDELKLDFEVRIFIFGGHYAKHIEIAFSSKSLLRKAQYALIAMTEHANKSIQ